MGGGLIATIVQDTSSCFTEVEIMSRNDEMVCALPHGETHAGQGFLVLLHSICISL